jgi:hypothetical protein
MSSVSTPIFASTVAGVAKSPAIDEAPNPSVTIVSAADAGYFWGLFLLAASTAKSQMGFPMNLLIKGFSDRQKALLEQFPGVRLHEISDDSARNLCMRKAEAFSHADTDYIAWLDSDCVVVGDVSKLIVPANREMQLRLRLPYETSEAFSHFYSNGEVREGLAEAVAETWRKDVGEREEARHDSIASSNCFVVHRRHLPFIARWEQQIKKVLPAENSGVVNYEYAHYWQTDESVLNSLILFADDAPEVSDYQMGDRDGAHVAHFVLQPKPWVRWTRRHIRYMPFVFDLLDWVKDSGLDLPEEIPPALRRSRAMMNTLEAYAITAYQQTRYFGGSVLRKVGVIT